MKDLRSSFEIDFSLFEKNFKHLKKNYSDKETIFMLKANAYGHGLLPLFRFTSKENLADSFGLASAFEALEIIFDESYVGENLFVFSHLLLNDPRFVELYKNYPLIPVIGTLLELKTFLSVSDFSKVPLTIKFNTGMNRLGFDLLDVDEVVKLLKSHGRRNIDHVMSHFANASLKQGNSRNQKQMQNFKKLLSNLRAQGLSIDATSLSNSGSLEQGFEDDNSHIRPGLMLYGARSSLENQNKEDFPYQLISSFQAKILKVFSISKGTPLGYGSEPIHADGLVVIVAHGYGDGFSTRNKGLELFFENERGQILKGKVSGRVNMDMTQIWFPPDTDLKQGEKLYFWKNKYAPFQNLCEKTKLIAYELFCQLSPRVKRVYYRS